VLDIRPSPYWHLLGGLGPLVAGEMDRVLQTILT